MYNPLHHPIDFILNDDLIIILTSHFQNVVDTLKLFNDFGALDRLDQCEATLSQETSVK